MTKQDKILEVLETIEESELISMWNERCQAYRYDDEEIFDMYSLDEFFGSMNFSEALNQIDTDNFSLNDDYFYFSIYGARSLTYIDDVVDLEELAEYIEDTEDTFGNSELEEIFEEDEEETA